MADTLLQHAYTLIRNGYNVMPIKRTPEGKDQPLVKYVNKETYEPRVFTDDDAREWAEKFASIEALALVTGVHGIATLDFDIDHPQLAQSMSKYLREKWPDMPIRTCNAPRFACMFRAEGSLEKAGQGRSDKFIISDTAEAIIELNCYVKPTTLLGTHRKTGKPYRWTRGHHPTQNPVDRLPELDLADIKSIFARFKGLADKYFPNWKRGPKGKLLPRRQPKTGNGLIDAQQVVKVSDERIQRLLDTATGDGRPEWLQMGMALHAHYEGRIEGLYVWDKWSRGFNNYEDGACEAEWEGFKVDGGVKVTTVEKEYQLEPLEKEKVNQASDDVLSQHLERYILVQQGRKVGDLESNSSESLTELADHNTAYANTAIVADPTDPKPKVVPVTKAWLESKHRRTVWDTAFMPGEDRVFVASRDGQEKEYYNLYDKPMFDEDAPIDKDMVKFFISHVKYLCGDDQQFVEYFFAWMAHMIQSPQERPHITPLLISTNTGTGRGALVSILSTLVGAKYVTDTTMNILGDPQAKTGYLADSILCTVPEVRVTGKERYSLSDNVKKVLTEERLNVNVKYGAESMRRVFTRFLMQSNHADPVVIDETDRRFNFAMNTKPPKSAEYYRILNGYIVNRKFLTSVYNFLRKHKVIRAHLFGRPLNNVPRKTVIAAARSHTAQAFAVFASIVTCYSHDVLEAFLTGYFQMHGWPSMKINFDEITRLEIEYCNLMNQPRIAVPDSTGGTAKQTCKGFGEMLTDENTLQRYIDSSKAIDKYFADNA